MIIYLDASIVVSLFSREETTVRAIAWLELQNKKQLSGSDWLWTEVSSALARKVRTGRLSTEAHADALQRIRQRFAPQLSALPIEAADFQAAASICDAYAVGLRAGDALHLAIAGRAGHMLATFDKTFAAGARALGYEVELIA